jgi:hypothetical protein
MGGLLTSGVLGWGKLCWACAVAAGGTIDTPAGPLTADEFASAAGISPS